MIIHVILRITTLQVDFILSNMQYFLLSSKPDPEDNLLRTFSFYSMVYDCENNLTFFLRTQHSAKIQITTCQQFHSSNPSLRRSEPAMCIWSIRKRLICGIIYTLRTWKFSVLCAWSFVESKAGNLSCSRSTTRFSNATIRNKARAQDANFSCVESIQTTQQTEWAA
jgi:hypothetical protein